MKLGNKSPNSFTHFILYQWRRKWQPTPVFLPGEADGQGILAGHGPWGRRESDMMEVTEQESKQTKKAGEKEESPAFKCM